MGLYSWYPFTLDYLFFPNTKNIVWQDIGQLWLNPPKKNASIFATTATIASPPKSQLTAPYSTSASPTHPSFQFVYLSQLRFEREKERYLAMPRTLVYMIIRIEVYVVMSLSRGWLMRAYAPAISYPLPPVLFFFCVFALFSLILGVFSSFLFYFF